MPRLLTQKQLATLQHSAALLLVVSNLY